MPSLRPVFGSTGAPASVALGQALTNSGNRTASVTGLRSALICAQGESPESAPPNPGAAVPFLPPAAARRKSMSWRIRKMFPPAPVNPWEEQEPAARPPRRGRIRAPRTRGNFVDGVVDLVAVDRPEQDVRRRGRQGRVADDQGAVPLVDRRPARP